MTERWRVAVNVCAFQNLYCADSVVFSILPARFSSLGNLGLLVRKQSVKVMRLALQALFCHDRNLTSGERERIENELRNNSRSVEFLRKIRQTTSAPLRKAPEVFADESFPDPNVVAEYLDCQLESTEISEEYERVCAESPEILAEVADCYDILNNRLPQPAVAPQNCRRQLYYVAWEEEPPYVSSNESQNLRDASDKSPYCSTRTDSGEPVIDVKIDPIGQPSPKVDKRNCDSRRSEVQVKNNSKGLRLRRLTSGVKSVLILLIVVGGINGYAKWRNFEKSQTFDSSIGVAQDGASPNGIPDQTREETSSSGFITTSEEDSPLFDDEVEIVDSGSEYDLDGVSEPPMLTMKPDDPVPTAPQNADPPGIGGKSGRRGLGSSNDGRREGIEIPDVNNDVFSRPMRY